MRPWRIFGLMTKSTESPTCGLMREVSPSLALRNRVNSVLFLFLVWKILLGKRKALNYELQMRIWQILLSWGYTICALFKLVFISLSHSLSLSLIFVWILYFCMVSVLIVGIFIVFSFALSLSLLVLGIFRECVSKRESPKRLDSNYGFFRLRCTALLQKE